MPFVFEGPSESEDFTVNDCDPNDPPKHSSPGQATTMGRCPRQYYYAYPCGIKSPPNGKLLIGSSTHRAAEVSMINKQDSGELLSNDDVAGVAAQTAHDYLSKPHALDDGESEAKVIDTSVALARTWNEDFGPLREPLRGKTLAKAAKTFDRWNASGESESQQAKDERDAGSFRGIEARIELTHKRLRRPVVGYIDLIEDEAENGLVSIRDIKTTGRKKAAWELRSLQMVTYSIAVRSAGMGILSIGYDVLLNPSKTRPFGASQIVEDFAPTKEVMKSVIDVYADVDDRLQKGVFPPNYGMHCSWCGYKALCDKDHSTTYIPMSV